MRDARSPADEDRVDHNVDMAPTIGGVELFDLSSCHSACAASSTPYQGGCCGLAQS